MPNVLPRCPSCGYALVKGQCPIPCKGKPLVDSQQALAPTPATIYWTPKAA